MPDLRATFANTFWRIACEPARRRLSRALQDPAHAQRIVLRRILTLQRHTEFSRRHQLHHDMTPAEFQSAVPLSDYSSMGADIDRMLAGQPDILTSGKPIAFERSSGSTAAAKYLPFTNALRAEFSEAIRAWMGDLLARHPKVCQGPAWWIVSPLRQPRETTSGGIPVGLATDDEYLGPIERRLASWLWAVPPAIAHLTDLSDNLDWTLRFLIQCRGLRLISIWNPGFLTLLWQRFLENQDAILTQLETGTGPTDVPFLTKHLRADPRRAAALRAHSQLTPQHLWPNLSLISGWADCEAAPHAAEVRSLFPHATFQPKGLLATEGVITIPWGVHTAAGIPALHSHFLEFLEIPPAQIPSSSSDITQPRLIHQLQPGKEYAVILTTSGGLWRYRLGDLVRVEGQAAATPRLRFVGRCDDVCDLCGEKLHPQFVAHTLRHHVRGFHLLSPNRSASPPHYVLFIKDPHTSASVIDEALSANPHYAYARSAGQLGPLCLFLVQDPDPSAVFLRHCAVLGQRAGTVKPTALHRAPGWESVFSGHFMDT